MLEQVYVKNRALERRVEQRTAELERANDELQRLSKVFEEIGAPIVLADLDAKITDVNPEAERVYGWSREELEGRSLLAFVPVDQHAAAERLLDRCRRGERVRNVEGVLVDKAGHRHDVLTTLSLLTDAHGEPVGIASLCKEINDLKATQAMLNSVNEELQSLARHDGLTGLPNRRYFDRTYADEFRRAARAGSRLSVLFFDLDHYKAFNDSRGHQAGDECLRVVAGVLRDCLRRPGDFVARYGGEEFVAVLPDTDRRGAAWTGERIRATIERRALDHPSSPTAPVVTVSVGVATARVRPNLSPHALLAAADKALYLAKSNGRNRVHIAHLPEPEEQALQRRRQEKSTG